MTPDFHRNTTTQKGDTPVTHHAKASSAGSTSGRAARRSPKLVLAAASALALALILGVALAAATAPTASIEDASEVSYVTAKAKGTVNPEDKETSYHFEYATQADFSDAVSAGEQGPLAAGSGSTSVEQTLSGLAPATTYHLRLVASNEDGPAEDVATNTFTTKAVAKPSATIETVSAVTATSAHFSGHVNPNAPGAAPQDPAFDASWHFECVPSCGNPGGSAVAADNTAHEVQADATELEPNKEYTVTLHASNAGGEETASETFQTEAVAPDVAISYPSNSTASTQTLRALVNPHNAALTDCHFEYGTNESYGQNVPCSPGPGVGNKPTLVTASLSGLQPDTSYHYRIVAENQAGEVPSPDSVFDTLSPPSSPSCLNPQFHQGASAHLPDCRAYEMVSPPGKNGGRVLAFSDRTRAAADGSALVFGSTAGFGDVHGIGITLDYLSRRDARPGTNGWSTHAITPGNIERAPFFEELVTGGGGPDSTYKGELSADLSHGIYTSVNPRTSDPDVAKVPNLYLADDLLSPGDPAFQLLTACPACASSGPLPPAPAGEDPGFAGASADFSHVIFESIQNLTDDAQSLAPDAVKLYEWTAGSGGGSVSLAGQVPATGTECGGEGPACVPAHSSKAGQGAINSSLVVPTLAAYNPNVVSRDGSRIYFTEPSATNHTAGRLYLRTGNGTPGASTVQVNIAEPTPNPTPLDDGQFQTATPDGSKMLFTTKENLLATDTSPSNRTDLYMYDTDKLAGHHLTLISSPDPGHTAEVQGTIGISDDGEYVYFLARGQLVSGQPDTSEDKIFVWHNGTIREVAATNSSDESSLLGTFWTGSPKTSRLTPDGTHLLFTGGNTGQDTPDELTHSRTGDTCQNGGGDFVCAEVYLYDATANGGAGSLACVSCTRLGGPAHDHATFISRADTGVASFSRHLNHPLSADGRYVFFSTGERLVPEDTNGVFDVYEYDSLTGEQRLLSSGESKEGSYFMDASLDGSDAFFVTAERISGWDTDKSRDLYDARANGGLPEPPPPPPGCNGDACQPPPVVLNDPTPASATFSGPGNPRTQQKKRHQKKRHKTKKRHQKQQRTTTSTHG